MNKTGQDLLNFAREFIAAGHKIEWYAGSRHPKTLSYEVETQTWVVEQDTHSSGPVTCGYRDDVEAARYIRDYLRELLVKKGCGISEVQNNYEVWHLGTHIGSFGNINEALMTTCQIVFLGGTD